MKDAFVESHRASAQVITAILFMVVGAGDALYGALLEKQLLFGVGALFFCGGALLFKLAKRNSH